MTIFDSLKRLDAYPKTLDEFSTRTIGGAAVTIISTIITISLFIAELNAFLAPNISEELFVDTTRSHKLRINLDVVIPRISCEYLSLDAMDSSGDQHLHIDHNIFKRRLDLEGTPIDAAKKENIQVTTKKENITENAIAKIENECGSCYGAQANATHCCNSCKDVIDAYREKKWNPDIEKFVQCKDSLKNEKLAEGNAFKEGCQIYGHMEVNRMGGSFHIAPGKSFSINHIHVHDVQPFSSSKFNTSHRIDLLSFGEQFNFANTHPLDHTEEISTEGAMMFQYYIKIVPTMFVPLNGPVVHTNQFSVTKHKKSVEVSGTESGMPGIFFSYELSPLMVKYTETSNSLGHFATNICSIIGGIFTVAGIFDALLYNSLHIIRKKIELGKFS